MGWKELKICAEACAACSLACGYCVTALLKSEYAEKLKNCTAVLLECIAICEATVAVASLNGIFGEQQCRLCIAACNKCAEVCEAHMQWEAAHCKTCADACRHCADTCEDAFNTVGNPVISVNIQ
ncbi:four-helix bundle copper-binding protein [Chitinophaga filiformis]|uniref:Four-helix bundle copper-binding protein n=1 Tax=Chitinophaga filiformis TaxID=104663 RepID=A0ABY4I917_CHIFI|nr:four-helix bundle copper-binding protein [Chitinophaga filiformis]UPK72575.1 four-helix bundle copper-binding protein [Chitinophaga filiformis]